MLGIECGISTYSEWLWEKMGPQFKEFHIFAEAAVDVRDDGPISRCWSRGKPLTDLIRSIKAYNPDVVYIQHEFGIFPNARYWLALISALQDRKVIVTFHSTYGAHHGDKIVCEAAVKDIVVHTEVARRSMAEEKQVPGRVHVIPHGSHPLIHRDRYWNIYRSPHTIVQFGFGFRYKGWFQALEVVAELKPRFPDVFWTGLFSESPFSMREHDALYEELVAYAEKLGVSENIALVRGYQSNVTLQSYLRTNRVALFPYIDNGAHTVLGCSGAARIAMANGAPTVTSHVPLFDDLEGVCPRPGTIAGLAAAVAELFDETKARAQVSRQIEFLEKTSWDTVARQYVELATH